MAQGCSGRGHSVRSAGSLLRRASRWRMKRGLLISSLPRGLSACKRLQLPSAAVFAGREKLGDDSTIGSRGGAHRPGVFHYAAAVHTGSRIQTSGCRGR